MPKCAIFITFWGSQKKHTPYVRVYREKFNIDFFAPIFFGSLYICGNPGFDEKHCINDSLQCKAEQKLLNICSSRVLCCLLKQRDRRSTHETENKVQLKPSLSVPSTAPQSPIMIDPVSLQLHIVY